MASQRLPSTSTLITAWCNQVNQYCSELQKSCTSLHAIVQRKPDPGSEGNFDIFIEDLNDVVSSALAELQQLEERTTDTLSFEELIVHCDALYKSNEDGIRKLELQLQQYGYSPVEAPKYIGEVMEDPSHKEIETDSQNSVEAISPPRSGATASSINDNEASVGTPMVPSHETRTVEKDAEYSPLFSDLGDLGNLESLGISATSLSALAGQEEPGEGSGSVHPPQYKLTFAESPRREDSKISSTRAIAEEDRLKTKYGSHWNSEAEIKLPPPPSIPPTKCGSTYGNDDRHLGPVISDKFGSEYGIGTKNSAPTCTISKKDVPVQCLETKKVTLLDEVTSAQYDNAPIWIKLQVSMQEINSAVTKINELIKQRSMGEQHANQFVLDQEDVQALGLGSKATAWFLINVDKLVTQSTNGVTTYRIRV